MIDILAGWALQLMDELAMYMQKKFWELCKMLHTGERALPGLSILMTNVIEVDQIVQKLSKAYQNPSESPASNNHHLLTEQHHIVRILFATK